MHVPVGNPMGPGAIVLIALGGFFAGAVISTLVVSFIWQAREAAYHDRIMRYRERIRHRFQRHAH